MFTTHVHYMQKIVVGRKARGVIDLDMPAEWNLKRIAKAEGLPVQELTVVVLDRDRNKEIIGEIRQVGARIKLISAGDVAGALEAALETRFGIHCMMGSGGATEGVLAACAIKTMGGDMQAKLYFRNDKEKEVAVKEGHKPDKILSIADLCSGKALGPGQWEWIAAARMVSRHRSSTGAVEDVLDGLLSAADQAMVNAFTSGFRVTQAQAAISKSLHDSAAVAAALESAQVVAL